MATRKNKAEEVEAKMEELEAMAMEDAYQVELQEEVQDPKVTMSMSELRKLIAEEVKRASGGQSAPAKTAEKKKFVAAKPARKVKIKLFKDNGRYSKPVFVAVNGKKYMVPRGVEVEVPEFIAKVLDESFRQDMDTADQLMQLEQKFREDTRKLR